jgi:hypothetical protein
VIRGTIFNALFLSTFVAKNDVLNEHHKNWLTKLLVIIK